MESRSRNTSRVEVSKREQSVEYFTPDSRTCTLHVSVGVASATVSLRDNFEKEKETKAVDISVGDVTNKGGGVGVGDTFDVQYKGNGFKVHDDAGMFGIGYGGPHVWYDDRKGFMYTLSGPSRYTTLSEIQLALKLTHHIPDYCYYNGQQTTITGLINNTAPVYGDFNGSIINFFDVFLSNK